MVSAMIELSRSLGLEPVAQGVETAGQLEGLRALGCRIAQGYLFSEPLVAAAAADLLASPSRLTPPPRGGTGGETTRLP